MLFIGSPRDRGLAEGDHVMFFENKGHLGCMPWECAVKHNFTTTMMNVCSRGNANGLIFGAEAYMWTVCLCKRHASVLG